MPSRDLTVRIDGDPSGFNRGMKSAEASARVFERELNRLEAKQHAAMTEVGTVAGATGAAIAFGLYKATQAAMDWESAWAGVTKTVDGTDAQMAKLEQDLRGLTSVLPATHGEIASVAEAAGALGIEQENIVSFTKTMIDLGETTNLTADEAATAMARLANIMGTPQDEIDRLGASLVELGNNGASTEAEITEMSLRIAGAGNQIGLTEGDVMGFSSALSSVGIEAEAGGTAISRVFIDIDTAVEQGGDKLEKFAEVSGMTSAEFVQAWEQDAGMATVSFIEGLGRLDESGQSTFGTLEELNLSEVRVRDTLLRTAGASDLLRESVETGNRAWDENTALVEEANKRYDTTAARVGIARNQIVDFGIDVGQTLLPAVGEAADKTAGFLDVIQSLPGPVKDVAAAGAAVAAAALLASGAFLVAAPRIAAFKKSVNDLGPKSQSFARGLSSAGTFLTGPWGLAIAGATLAVGYFAAKKAEAAAEVREFTRAIEADSGALAENTRQAVVHRLEEEGMLEVANELGISLTDVTDAALGNQAAYDEVTSALQGMIDEYVQLAGTEDAYKASNLDSTKAAEERAEGAQNLLNVLNGTNSTINKSVAQYNREAEAMGTVGDATSSLTPETRALGDSMGVTGMEAENAAKAMDTLDAELRALFDTEWSVEEATDAVRRELQSLAEQTQQAAESGDKHAYSLKGNSTAALENREQVRGLVRDTGELIEEEARAGATKDELRDKTKAWKKELEDELVQLGFNRDEVKKYTSALDGVQEKVDTSFAQPGMETAQSEAKTLRRDYHNIQEGVSTNVEVSNYYATLERVAEIKRSIQSINGKTVYIDVVGRGKIPEGMADGGILEFYADGGTSESHVAQIAPAGAWRVWAEPETGGEAYIPLAPSKRARSVAVLDDVATRFGYELRRYADGGMFGAGSGTTGGAQPLIGSLTVVTQASEATDVAAEIAYTLRKARRGSR